MKSQVKHHVCGGVHVGATGTYGEDAAPEHLVRDPRDVHDEGHQGAQGLTDCVGWTTQKMGGFSSTNMVISWDWSSTNMVIG